MSEKKLFNTEAAPKAIGPYNQAVQAGDTLYVSGQIAFLPETMQLVATGIADETHQVLKNVSAILNHAGYSFEDVVKTSIFISNMDDFGTINEVYAQYFVENQPARETVAVKTLPKNVNVEISVIAWKKGS
ncbi:RidA family protein [Sphingobacterium sp. lm-10]|uniref:RidA family protein n=1 Tax=Sphingobacterium sp. lm-10 TaxID=2944904 RepID=UPI0020207F7F|nr:RidA family protein [Sphingobacterium sp. lm-10]MCL7988512.1 RidA family protein [Sphingobacterium sp. lm-10]MCL8000800.1 RidA family protein [Brucella sp. 21LCYQ03]